MTLASVGSPWLRHARVSRQTRWWPSHRRWAGHCCHVHRSGDLGAAQRNATDASISASLDASDGPARERRFYTASVGAKAASDDRVIRV
jgi:hypothetical protein